jgi:lipopolysaccharide export LptBFGC system permease protein LptF
LRTLQLYIIKELFPPILLSGLFFTFVMVVLRLFDLADVLLQAGVSGGVLGELVVLVVVTLLSLTIPMAVLLGTLIGVGRLTSENEILAMRVGGVSIARAFWPVLFLGALFSGGLMWANNHVIPRMFGRIDAMRYEIQFDVLTNLKPGRFYSDLGGESLEMTLYYEEPATRTAPVTDGGLEMGGVNMRIKAIQAELLPGTGDFVDGEAPVMSSEDPGFWDLEPDERQAIREAEEAARDASRREFLLFAHHGGIEGDPADNSIRMILRDGSLVPIDWDAPGQVTEVRFGEMVTTIGSGSEDTTELLGPQPREMTGPELFHDLVENMPKGYIHADFSTRIRRVWREWFSARNELIQRFTVPMSIIAFLLIAIPLAIEVRPRAKSLALLIAFGLMGVYYMLQVLGASLAANGLTEVPAVAALMLPNIVVGAIGAVLLWRANRR